MAARRPAWLDRFAANSYSRQDVALARELGLGMEVDAFIFPVEGQALAQAKGEQAISGLAPLSLHGTVVSRDVAVFRETREDTLLALYDASIAQARAYGIDRVVFHSDYKRDGESDAAWLARQAAFWARLLRDKPPQLRVCFENYVADTPQAMAALHDSIDDPRFCLCLDTGHALCNSSIPVADWIRILGRRVRHVHLHGNDGLADRHWPLDRGVLDMRAVIGDIRAHTAAEMIVLECSLAQSLPWLERTFG